MKRNTISGFHRAGIALEGSSTRSNFVVDNDCHDNQTGIAVTSYATRNVLDGNTTTLNRGDGMVLSANANANILTRNRGRLNAGSGLVALGARNLINDSTFDNNTAFGICARQANFDAGENRASGNGEGNISFDCPPR